MSAPQSGGGDDLNAAFQAFSNEVSIYEVLVRSSGDLISYRRTRRYTRGKVDRPDDDRGPPVKSPGLVRQATGAYTGATEVQGRCV